MSSSWLGVWDKGDWVVRFYREYREGGSKGFLAIHLKCCHTWWYGHDQTTEDIVETRQSSKTCRHCQDSPDELSGQELLWMAVLKHLSQVLVGSAEVR